MGLAPWTSPHPMDRAVGQTAAHRQLKAAPHLRDVWARSPVGGRADHLSISSPPRRRRSLSTRSRRGCLTSRRFLAEGGSERTGSSRPGLHRGRLPASRYAPPVGGPCFRGVRASTGMEFDGANDPPNGRNDRESLGGRRRRGLPRESRSFARDQTRGGGRPDPPVTPETAAPSFGPQMLLLRTFLAGTDASSPLGGLGPRGPPRLVPFSWFGRHGRPRRDPLVPPLPAV